MDSRGFKNVRIFVSGGLDDESVRTLSEAGADGSGVGTSVSSAQGIDFSMDIVEREGKFVAKGGKLGGKKNVWRCEKCLLDYVLLEGVLSPSCSNCGGQARQLLVKLLEHGRPTSPLPTPDKIRELVIDQLRKLNTTSDELLSS